MREGDAAPVLCKSAAVLATATLSLDSALALSHNLAEPADTRAARVAQLAADALAAVSAVECSAWAQLPQLTGAELCPASRWRLLVHLGERPGSLPSRACAAAA